MGKHTCAACAFRKKYDQAPKSFLGRLWRFHINWCPGFKSYICSLDEKERHDLAVKYGLKKFM